MARQAWAYEAAYRMYRNLLFGAALTVLRDRADAEDCVHDVLVRLWQRGHAYSTQRGSLRAFLIVCARNEALSRVRRDANRKRILESLEPLTDQEQLLDAVALSQGVRALTGVQREAIQLAYYEGLTHAEIANRLGTPLGTVKSRLSEALRSLRGALSERHS